MVEETLEDWQYTRVINTDRIGQTNLIFFTEFKVISDLL